jgi:hypothetical protein
MRIIYELYMKDILLDNMKYFNKILRLYKIYELYNSMILKM